MTQALSVNGIRIELIDRGQGNPLLFLHPGIGIDPDAPVLERLAARSARDRADASGLRRLRSCRGPSITSTTSPISISTCSTSSTCATSSLVGVSLGGWIAAEIAVKSTARLSQLVLANRGRHQGRRPRDPRHRRHLRDAPRRSSTSSPIRSRRRQARLQGHAGRRGARRRAQPRSDARATPGRPTCTTPSSRAGCIASASRRCSCGATADRILREAYGRAYCAADPRRALRADRARRPLPASRAAGGIRARGQLRGRVRRRGGFEPRHEKCEAFNHESLSLHRAALSRRWNDHARLAAREPAQPQVRSRRSRPTCSTATTTNGCSPTSSARHHAQRASPDRDLHVVDRRSSASRCWRGRPRRARLLVLGYPIGHRPDPLRCAEELVHHRRDLARPARHGLHQGRALRVRRLEPEPGRRHGPLLGGARFHHQGDDHATTSRSTGRASTSTTARSTSGRARGSSRIRRSGARPAARATRACSASAAT